MRMLPVSVANDKSPTSTCHYSVAGMLRSMGMVMKVSTLTGGRGGAEGARQDVSKAVGVSEWLIRGQCLQATAVGNLQRAGQAAQHSTTWRLPPQPQLQPRGQLLPLLLLLVLPPCFLAVAAARMVTMLLLLLLAVAVQSCLLLPYLAPAVRRGCC